MLKLARWCISHRRQVVMGWVAVAVLTTVLAGAVGRQYATNFSLPGTESQRASDLLQHEFKAQSGDLDTIVFHVSHGTVASPAVRAAIAPLLGTGEQFAARRRGGEPLRPAWRPAGVAQRDDRVRDDLLRQAGQPVAQQHRQPMLDGIKAIHVPGLRVAAGGQVIEQAEGFSIGPATGVGVIAALIILLLTFGSLTAAGMPLITAGLGLITGVALIGLATHVTSMSNVAPELALMIGLGVGIDYALFIVTRFKENYLKFGDVQRSVLQAMDTSGRAILLAGSDRGDRAAWHVRHRGELHVRAGDRLGACGTAHARGVADAAAGAAVALRRADSAPARRAPSRPPVRRPAPAQTNGAAVAVAPRASAWRRWSQTVQKRPVAAGDRLAGGDGRAAGRRYSRCGLTPATPETTRPTSAPVRPLTCWPRASVPGSTARFRSSPSCGHAVGRRPLRRCGPLSEARQTWPRSPRRGSRRRAPSR